MILIDTIKTNEETGMQTYIYVSESGKLKGQFGAILKDLDSDQVVTVIYFPEFDRALAKAADILGK
jgi:hypothetical protein